MRRGGQACSLRARSAPSKLPGWQIRLQHVLQNAVSEYVAHIYRPARLDTLWIGYADIM